ncbi:hypothetical protein [Arthrobacter rhombi]|uniref:hypothetical protein n=1 Tax=Arthrobacter rhombi TaxID=71253 RepID=UPI001178765F|nr:hypothetical protein [Arthrobacter rhombi]
MADTSNNPYAFPLPPCTAHTFQWEDGERDECYRCGATLHAKHLDTFPNVEPGHDTVTVAECHRRGLPGTVTELATEALLLNIAPSELLRRLEGVYASLAAEARAANLARISNATTADAL